MWIWGLFARGSAPNSSNVERLGQARLYHPAEIVRGRVGGGRPDAQVRQAAYRHPELEFSTPAHTKRPGRRVDLVSWGMGCGGEREESRENRGEERRESGGKKREEVQLAVLFN